MDKVKERAELIGKKISPLLSVSPTNITAGNLGAVKIPGGETQPPTTSPPSPPPPTTAPPPPTTVPSPPPKPPPATASPPPPPPSPSPPPPPPANPPPSPPHPPPQNTPGDSPPVTTKPPPSPPPLFQPPPTLTQPNPVSPPSPPNQDSPFSPPSPTTPVDSGGGGGGGGSPPFSSPSLPVAPQTPNSTGQPFRPPDSSSSSSGGQNSHSQPSSSSSLSPSPHSSSGSRNHSGSSSPPNVNHRNGGNGQDKGSDYDKRTIIGVGIAGAMVVTLIAVLFLLRRRRKNRRGGVSRRPNQHYLPSANISVKPGIDGYNYYGMQHGNGNNSGQNSSGEIQRPERGTESEVIGATKTVYTYEELSQITEGFAQKNIVGEGGFGCVYKGVFPGGQKVAIKQLKASNAEGYREFKAEVEIISRVHHRHLVSLVGYCILEQLRFLIYEFVPNNTLDHHLHGRDLPVLDWTKRVRIAIGAAKGLAYLHEDCHPKIIHRDIKSSNILLDNEFEAQVADFGLARLNDTTQSHISTRVMGTFGYLAPEYASSGKLTDKSDVFSFGVVLLELITSRKPVDPTQPLGEESLVEWARPRLIEAIETGDVSNLVDQRLENHYVETELYTMIETAASCIRHSAPKRPRMAQVVRALDSKQDMSDLTNGVKVGQSTVYNSGQYSQEIRNFMKNSYVSEGTYSDYGTSGDYSSHELESRALNAFRDRY